MPLNGVETIFEDEPYRNATRALINLSAFEQNLVQVRNLAPEAAADAGVEYLAVARVVEGLKLRRGGVFLPIVLLGVEWGCRWRTCGRDILN